MRTIKESHVEVLVALVEYFGFRLESWTYLVGKHRSSLDHLALREWTSREF